MKLKHFAFALVAGISLALSGMVAMAGPVVSLGLTDAVEEVTMTEGFGGEPDMIVLASDATDVQPKPLAAGECDAKWLITSFFQERRDGTNCPPTSFEKAVGTGILLGVIGVGVAGASGGFPVAF